VLGRYKLDHKRITCTEVVQILDDLGEVLHGLLVEVGDRDASGEYGIIWVLGSEVCSGFGCEVL
jgi:hypothetical protein